MSDQPEGREPGRRDEGIRDSELDRPDAPQQQPAQAPSYPTYPPPSADGGLPGGDYAPPPSYGSNAAPGADQQGNPGSPPSYQGYQAYQNAPVQHPPGGPSPYGSRGPSGPQDHRVGVPMQPGVVPLRPLTLGDLYSGSFATMRSNPKTMIGVPLVVFTIPALISFVISVVRRQTLGTGYDAVEATLGGLGGGDNISSLLASLASFVLGGFLIAAVRAAVVGRQMAPGEAWRVVVRRLPQLIGFTLLYGFALIVAIGVLVLLVVLSVIPAMNGGSDNVGAGAIVGIILGVLAAALVVGVLVLIASVWFVFAPQVIVLEGVGVFGAFGRSSRLVKGSFWRVLGIVLLTSLITGVAAGVLMVPIGVIAAGLATGIFGTSLLTTVISSALMAIGMVAVYGLTQPFSAGVTSLLYLDRRMRSEGYALDLLQEAQSTRPAGA